MELNSSFFCDFTSQARTSHSSLSPHIPISVFDLKINHQGPFLIPLGQTGSNILEPMGGASQERQSFVKSYTYLNPLVLILQPAFHLRSSNTSTSKLSQ